MQRTLGQAAERVFAGVVVPRIDDRIELRVDPLRPLDRLLQQLDRRHFSVRDHPRQFDRVEIRVALYCHVNVLS